MPIFAIILYSKDSTSFIMHSGCRLIYQKDMRMINTSANAKAPLVIQLARSVFYVAQGLMFALAIAIVDLTLLSSMNEGARSSNTGVFLVIIIATAAIFGCFYFLNQNSSAYRDQSLGLRLSFWRQTGFFLGITGLVAIMCIIRP